MKDNCFQNNFIKFLIDPKYRVWRHLSIIIYIIAFSYDSGEIKEYSGDFHYYVKWLWIVYFLAMVYINMYVLIPKLLFKGEYVTYLVCLVLLIVCSFILVKNGLNYFDQYRIMQRKVFSSFFREILATSNLLTILVFSSTSIKLFQQWARDTERIIELETNSLQLELKELKNQINPHFLFNMLNNVNVLVKKNPDKASAIIMKLSDFLRYQLYDNNQPSVLLLSEIQFLNDFMELEKIRRDDFNFRITIENEDSNSNMISQLVLPPNLFTTFIENAIKHSADLDHPSKIDISFTINKRELVFSCSNTKPAEPIDDRQKGGLGLANTRRRLDLLYAKDYKLDIDDLEEKYTVTLTLPI